MPKMKVNMGTPAAPNWVVMDAKDALTLQGKSAADFTLVGHGHQAKDISITDTGNKITATDVEGALAEISDKATAAMPKSGGTFTGSVDAPSFTNSGFDFILGNGDQSSRGNSGSSRAIVKNAGNTLVLNFAGDFTGGVEVQGITGLKVPSGDVSIQGTNLVRTRLNAGQLEYWDGGAWKSVSAVKSFQMGTTLTTASTEYFISGTFNYVDVTISAVNTAKTQVTTREIHLGGSISPTAYKFINSTTLRIYSSGNGTGVQWEAIEYA